MAQMQEELKKLDEGKYTDPSIQAFASVSASIFRFYILV